MRYPEEIRRARLIVTIASAVDTEKHVRWIGSTDDSCSYGTVRTGLWAANMSTADPTSEFEGTYLRITLRSGFDTLLSVRDVMAMLSARTLGFMA